MAGIISTVQDVLDFATDNAQKILDLRNQFDPPSNPSNNARVEPEEPKVIFASIPPVVTVAGLGILAFAGLALITRKG
ncbi:hypothetical protein [Coraliomargarita parva]|uniref:hypothetical protein n=1 Tax=Coraliomargarita parva TaxID=3014050 RepID=UPI0022B2CA7D|nr:hypothetical protein [Coraliomargarita parva]